VFIFTAFTTRIFGLTAKGGADMFDALRLAVIIPLAAALVTGSLVGLVMLTLAAWQRWPSVYAYIAAAGSALVSWLAWSARFVELVEYRLAPSRPKAALSQDPGAQTVNLHIHDDTDGYPSGSFLDRLPVSDAGLTDLANLIISGRSLTTSAMTRPGGPLDRPTWEALRDRLVNAGLLAWRSGIRQYGVEVTHRGMIVFSRLAEPKRPTHPL
jgi:hypothetical protein